jgi:hypothetical protein
VAVLVEPAFRERRDAAVELGAEPAQLALADAVDAEGPHEGVDLAGRHTPHGRRGDDGEEGLLGAPPRLEEPGAEAPRP